MIKFRKEVLKMVDNPRSYPERDITQYVDKTAPVRNPRAAVIDIVAMVVERQVIEAEDRKAGEVPFKSVVDTPSMREISVRVAVAEARRRLGSR